MVYDILKQFIKYNYLHSKFDIVRNRVFIKRNSGMISELAYEKLNLFLFAFYVWSHNNYKNDYYIKYFHNRKVFLVGENALITLEVNNFIECLSNLIERFGADNKNGHFDYFYNERDCTCYFNECFYKDLGEVAKVLEFDDFFDKIVQKYNCQEQYNFKLRIKKAINKKFKIGQQYSLKITKKNSSFNPVYKTFILKKFAYKIKEKELPILIMKQIDGPKNNMFTLSKNDCLLYHVKYEDGLQVFSMNLPFKEI